MLDLLAIVFVIIAIIDILMSFIYILTNGKIFKSIFHDRLGWHIVTKESFHDGCSLHGICIICGKECKQDSQGNWY